MHAALALLPFLPAHLPAAALESEPATGPWRAWLDSPGGELPFELLLEDSESGLRAFVVNGPERIRVEGVEARGGRLVLSIEPYDSHIEAEWSETGDALEGTWSRPSGPTTTARLAFHARAGAAPRFAPDPDAGSRPVEAASAASVAGRWAVDFASDDLPAVAEFEEGAGGEVTGTFLTATGDYRYLAGSFADGRLRLSTFDGAHAFLFDARLGADGRLSGDFWSRDTWHETWTARRDPEAAVPDPLRQTSWNGRASLADLLLPDLDGRARSLAEPGLAGDVTILQLFGTWCPNCNDETAYLVELSERYAARGLSILGLAFELTGDFARDARQVRRYAELHRIPYPLFVAGTADKGAASQAFPAVDRVRSYPTTIFLDALGRVRAVHSGFSGPATGAENERLRADFEGRIEELLREGEGGAARARFEEDLWMRLAGAGEWKAWFPPRDALRFELDTGGRRCVLHVPEADVVGRPRREPVRLNRDAVWIGETVLRFEEATGLLLDPRDPDRRFGAAGAEAPPVEEAAPAPAELAAPDALRRREALARLAATRGPGGGAAEALALLEDPSVEVRIEAAWTLGHCGETAAVAPLLACLSHPNAALRREAARALGRLPHRNGGLATALEPLLEDPDPLVRAAARDVVAFENR